jgi:uncharacterized membrane protein
VSDIGQSAVEEPVDGDETDEEVEELIDDLEDLEETAPSHEHRQAIRQAIGALNRVTHGRLFGLDDLAQQITGGFILSAPFVVTEEVWSLAAGMNRIQWVITVFIVFGVGYATLYGADHDRDPDQERSILGVPFRYISLLLISYLSVTILAFLLGAPETFEATGFTTAKAISVGAIFSVVGAATADSVF